jgi:phenylacetate-CoA ligase
MIWNKKYETMSRKALTLLQSERLQGLVKTVYKNNAFYRAKMDAAGVKPSAKKASPISPACPL